MSRRPILAFLVLGIGVSAAAQTETDRLLQLKVGSFDPTKSVPAFGPDWSARELAPDEEGLFVVQWNHRVNEAVRDRLVDLGVERLEYVPDDAYLLWASPRQVDALRTDANFRAALRFHPAMKVDPDLRAAAPVAAAELVVALGPGTDTVAATASLIELGAEIVEWDGPGDEVLAVSAPGELLDDIAALEPVVWVQKSMSPQYRNNTVNWVIQSNQPNDDSIHNQGILGDGVIIGHIDGAIDESMCWFDDNVSIGPSHRKLVVHNGSGTGSGDGHGTHTAGTAAGDQEPVTGGTNANGLAPKSRLAHTNLSLISSSNLRSQLESLYNSGARVFTNSWGNDGTSAYDQWSKDIDLFNWQNQDALPCWAATNTSTLRNPENAKNCLSVGATLTSPDQAFHCSGGRGPTNDGRRKPEIYAPGCGIVSANNGTSCSTTSSSGTSMACPAIAGAGALVVEYFEKGWYPSGSPNASDAFSPSGSLVKAVMINASQDMSGVSGYPSNTEGWGRLNLERGLNFGEARELIAHDCPPPQGFNDTGETHSYGFEVLGSQSLEITLCFIDKDAATFSNPAAVNDLDLEVISPTGSTFRGNVFSGGQSTTGGSFDEDNNVERVRRDNPELGVWTVNVHAALVTTSKNQSYSLAINGRIVELSGGSFEKYGAGLAGSGGIEPDLSGVGAPDIGSSVSLDTTGGLGGAAARLLLGFDRASLPFNGGTLNVALPWIVFNRSLSGSGPGNGTDSLGGNIPNDNNLVGARTNFQVLIFDAGAVDGMSMTRGLEMVIGQ